MAIESIELSGIEKASVLLMALGANKSAEVFKHLNSAEIEKLSGEIVGMRKADPNTIQNVVAEFEHLCFLADGLGKREMGRPSGVNPVAAVSADKPFSFMANVDAVTIARVLSEEPSQVIALVLKNLRPEKAADVLALFSEGLQAEVAVSICSKTEIAPEVVSAIDEALQGKYSTLSKHKPVQDGPEALIKILSRAGRATEKTLLGALNHHDPSIGDQVRSMLFVFEDFATLDDESVRLVLRRTDRQDLCLAMKGADDQIKERFFVNMTDKAVENAKQEIELMGPAKVRDIEGAQQRIVNIARDLISRKEIVISNRVERAIH